MEPVGDSDSAAHSRQSFRLISASERSQDALLAQAKDQGEQPGDLASKRRALVVLGMHRSGTSILTAMLCTAGADAPREPIPALDDHPTGYWEPAGFATIHDEIFRQMGMTWDSPLPASVGYLRSSKSVPFRSQLAEQLRTQYPDSHFFCVKDPRMARLVPLWAPLFRAEGIEPNYIIIARNPMEVAANLKRHNGFEESKSLMLWLRHTLEAELYTRGENRVFVTYDQLMIDWRASLRNIGQRLNVSWPKRDASITFEFERIISGSLRQHSASVDDLEARTDIPYWIASAYRACVASSEGYEDAQLAKFDYLRAQLDAADKAYEPLIVLSENEEQKETVGASEHSQVLGEIQRVKQEWADARSRAERLQSVNESMAAQISKLESIETALQSELEASRAQVAESIARAERSLAAQTELEQATAAATKLAQNADLSAQLAQHQMELECAAREAAELRVVASEEAVQRLRQESEDARLARIDLERRLTDLDEALKQQNFRMLDLQARAVSAVGRAQAEVEETEQQWFVLFQELESVRQQLQEGQARISGQAATIQTLEQKLDETQTLALEQKREICRQHDGLRIEHERLKDTWQRTKESLREERERVDSVTAELALQRGTEARYTEQITNLEEQVERGAAYAAHLLEELGNKSRCIDELTSQNSDMETEMEAMRSAAISDKAVMAEYVQSLKEQVREIPALRECKEQLIAQTEELLAAVQVEGAQVVTLIDVVQASHFWKIKRFLNRVRARLRRKKGG